ncbi:MAG: GNAT family N-acetyltransferase [Acholeplasmataceae bacterium]
MDFLYENNRIYVQDDQGKTIVEATFPTIEDGVVNIDHTFVDPSLRGQGIASKLMHEVYRYVKEKGYEVVYTCPYATVWFKRNPDKTDIIAERLQESMHPECRIV